MGAAKTRNKHGLDYPWGAAEFDPACANTEESNLGQTTPVDMYPAGRSADGVWDMAGNISELASDGDERDPAHVWVKGGCWVTDKDYTKASADIGAFRSDGHDVIGFRVVVVPIARNTTAD